MLATRALSSPGDPASPDWWWACRGPAHHIYGIALPQTLHALGSVETHLVLSDGARRTIQLEFFELSLRQFGENSRTTLSLALCLDRLQRLPEALAWLDRTLALDPTNETAVHMRPSPPSWRQPRSPFSEQSRRRKTSTVGSIVPEWPHRMRHLT